MQSSNPHFSSNAGLEPAQPKCGLRSPNVGLTPAQPKHGVKPIAAQRSVLLHSHPKYPSPSNPSPPPQTQPCPADHSPTATQTRAPRAQGPPLAPRFSVGPAATNGTRCWGTRGPPRASASRRLRCGTASALTLGNSHPSAAISARPLARALPCPSPRKEKSLAPGL